jgi:ketosteroid isomerase-like protein
MSDDRHSGLTAADRQALAAGAEPFVASLIAGDAAALSMHYAEDAVLLPPGRDPVVGRAAIREFFASFPPVISLEPTVEEIDGSTDIAFVRGSSRVTMSGEDGGTEREVLKFVEIHRKQADGSWLMTVDIWNRTGEGSHHG